MKVKRSVVQDRAGCVKPICEALEKEIHENPAKVNLEVR
jgi:hypothetical protein